MFIAGPVSALILKPLNIPLYFHCARDFPTKILSVFHISPIRPTYPAHCILLDATTVTLSADLYDSRSSSLRNNVNFSLILSVFGTYIFPNTFVISDLP